ncbi:GNAT family N-acetyltransferase [Hephaestia mangrovi]|uniref:GNAT family N-acetyltransferase n=1 Tax=Hephaestia mangrovi TaxID=2873268 RepID=UPI001CA5FDFD|nr:GNAT family N-acetyltransferase [Hephaestia mangrovi]MBY8828985.1 GNAT family N-acetyltransferase [Hephaestia mangrovi]
MIAYRAATPGDGAALAQMAARSFTETFGSLYPASDLAHFLDTTFGAGLPSQLDDPAYTIRLATEDDRIIGFAKLGPVAFPGDWPAGATELHQLYVLGGWHGEGVGPALLDWAIATARAAGHSELLLSVYIDNRRARRFYDRYGFEEIGRYEYRVGETIDDDRIMRLAL